jgi:hypothetical protein
MEAAINEVLRRHDHKQDAHTLDVDHILAVIKGLPAMQEEEERKLGHIIDDGAGSSESVNKAAVANHYRVRGRNALRREILADLGETE